MISIENKKVFKKVGTHDGKFHADEVMATAILKKIFKIEVVRTRDIKKLNSLDIVYDVGRGEFDHHGIEKECRENQIPYAACGLIWREFGKDVIALEEPSLMEEEILSIFDYVDKVLIEGIDAYDNGIKPQDDKVLFMNISTILSAFNPPWYSEESEEEDFFQAVEMASSILQNTIKRRLEVVKAKEFVLEAYKNRQRKELLVLDQYCPWQENLRDIDEEDEVIFTIYPNDGNFAMQTVKDKDRELKMNLPKEWAGKEKEELAEITGVDDAVFCHSGRFMAVAGSFDGIIKMADIALKTSENEKNPEDINQDS